MRVLTPLTYVQDSDAQKLHSASLELECSRCLFCCCFIQRSLTLQPRLAWNSLCYPSWPWIYGAERRREPIPRMCPLTSTHPLWCTRSQQTHTHTHIFLNRKWTTKLESVLLSNPEFQTTLQGSPVLYLLSQTSMLFFYLNMQIRKPFALISLRNYRFPVHRSQIICDYK